eukprot:SAG11_NODE_26820_length_340_cov_1.020747_1_plen_43_part_10
MRHMHVPRAQVPESLADYLASNATNDYYVRIAATTAAAAAAGP